MLTGGIELGIPVVTLFWDLNQSVVARLRDAAKVNF
jgi:hypothetical protein